MAEGKKGPAAAKPPRDWTAELQADLDRILTVGEECISASELKALLLAKGRGSGHEAGFNLYDGFEPSGRMHIAQGVFKAMNVNKCTQEGTNSTFIFWVADWFALMNDKMGGDLDKIKNVGLYLIEVWKAAGMDLSNVVFKWASEEITDNGEKYWPTMLDVARRFNITRIKKCCQIMGRLEGNLTAAQILYPLMQCTDVFFLKADICQLGVDQRKVNMLAREYCEAAKIKNKPIILSHHMLYGLKAGQEKMSKSDPDSAIFMEDAAEDVERKIMNAYCPSKGSRNSENTESNAAQSEDVGKESMHLKNDDIKNPCLDYIENIIFSPPGAVFTAGGIVYTDYATVRTKFLNGEISEETLKRGLVEALNVLLEPVRQHFTTDQNAKNLLALIQQYKQDAKAVVAEKEIRRLNLPQLGKVPPESHLVFAPVPNASPTLQEAINTLALLHNAGDKPPVLFLSDWSARVCNACDGDLKGIDAYFKILTTSLAALDPTMMEKVQIVFQSEAILADPSNYWISVINVGRHFMLDDIMGSEMNDADGVGWVVARLMKVADVAGVEPASVAFVDGTDEAVVTTKLINSFFKEKLAGLRQPIVMAATPPSLLLQQRESSAHKTENDEYYLLDDPKVDGKSKMKKAFCEPGNVSFCPPISIASVFSFGFSEGGEGKLTIPRSPDNGGDIVFSNRGELEAAFSQGEQVLHPGDLKGGVIPIMVSTLDKLAAGIKADGDAIKAGKTLKALAKKLAKKK